MLLQRLRHWLVASGKRKRLLQSLQRRCGVFLGRRFLGQALQDLGQLLKGGPCIGATKPCSLGVIKASEQHLAS